MTKNVYHYFSIFTILLFGLGFFNILFSWLGFICMITPFVILKVKGKNLWCQRYCPRANLYTLLFKKTKTRPTPKWLISRRMSRVVLIYFLFNLFILIMSTIMVSLNRIEPMEMIRFMIAFRVPWDIPQLIDIPYFPAWSIHLSFRMYSMMFTTTVFGLVLGWLFKPRTWCTICPVMTISNMVLTHNKNKGS